jgi:hypothetical protein
LLKSSPGSSAPATRSYGETTISSCRVEILSVLDVSGAAAPFTGFPADRGSALPTNGSAELPLTISG